MRLKVLFFALALAGVMLGTAVWLTGIPPAPLIPANVPVTASAAAPSTVKYNIQAVHTRPVPASPIDPASAEGILADLEKPDLSIRKAALQRARELDNRSIIPGLRVVAARRDDGREKEAILDTINYLELPSVVEDMETAKAARAAAGLPDPPQSLTNRWTGLPLARKD